MRRVVSRLLLLRLVPAVVVLAAITVTATVAQPAEAQRKKGLNIAAKELCLRLQPPRWLIASRWSQYGPTAAPESVHVDPLALVVWNHASGGIEAGWPNETSPLRIERFAGQITTAHVGW